MSTTHYYNHHDSTAEANAVNRELMELVAKAQKWRATIAWGQLASADAGERAAVGAQARAWSRKLTAALQAAT
jgi:hypothetical protein